MTMRYPEHLENQQSKTTLPSQEAALLHTAAHGCELELLTVHLFWVKQGWGQDPGVCGSFIPGISFPVGV